MKQLPPFINPNDLMNLPEVSIDEACRILQELENGRETEIVRLLERPEFYHNLFFACALVPKARKKIRELLAQQPALFEPLEGEIIGTVHSYEGIAGINNTEIDACVKLMLLLHHRERQSGDSLQRSLSIVRCAFPKLHGMCKSGGADDVFHTLMRIKKIKLTDVESLMTRLTSEGFYILCVLLFLKSAMGMEMHPLDGAAAKCMRFILNNLNRISEPWGGGCPDKAQKDYASLVQSELDGSLIPCSQIIHSPFITAQSVRYYNLLYDAAGVNLDLRRHLEAAIITEHEMGRLVLIENEVGYRLRDSVLPFLLIKQSLMEQSYLQEQLEDTRTALKKLQEQQARVIPTDKKVEELEQKNKALEKESEGLRGDLRSSNNYIRSLKGELSQLRKESRQKDEELAGVKQMRKEIAELQEAVYQLLTEQAEGIREPQDDGSYQFPYTDLPEGMVCFGGHEQWINKMQEYFPSVRFIPVDYRYNSNIIRNAPCIWIHSGYISHKMFSRIIYEARAHRITTHYFHSLSVLSCARKLVQIMEQEST